jgi:HPt (histidine-containing phosphotransfer) domain-containing protein
MINWCRVEELRDEVGSDDFEEVVDLFLSEVQEVVDRLSLGMNVATLEEDMHFLKGSAMNLGFDELSALCQKGEKMANTGEGASFDLPNLLNCYSDSRAQFLAEYNLRLSA